MGCYFVGHDINRHCGTYSEISSASHGRGKEKLQLLQRLWRSRWPALHILLRVPASAIMLLMPPLLLLTRGNAKKLAWHNGNNVLYSHVIKDKGRNGRAAGDGDTVAQGNRERRPESFTILFSTQDGA